jgi:large subunit ribosomal protein L21
MTTYAIVQTGGKQYRVTAGDFIDVEKLPVEVGATVELPHVLLLSQEDQLLVGRPHVEGARVVAEVREQGKDTKIVVFKYKAKTRYRKKQGHRQRFTRLQIMELVAP